MIPNALAYALEPEHEAARAAIAATRTTRAGVIVANDARELPVIDYTCKLCRRELRGRIPKAYCRPCSITRSPGKSRPRTVWNYLRKCHVPKTSREIAAEVGLTVPIVCHVLQGDRDHLFVRHGGGALFQWTAVRPLLNWQQVRLAEVKLWGTDRQALDAMEVAK